ncbi:MAG: type II toxin-antitoxin system VapB family antitoxin [Gammaproteobacteria bacterium]
MRTNIVLDDELIAEAMRLAGVTTRREMVDRALREYVARHRQREILELAGKGLIDPGYDVRAVRSGMDDGPG